jgi:hypothetical protein
MFLWQNMPCRGQQLSDCVRSGPSKLSNKSPCEKHNIGLLNYKSKLRLCSLARFHSLFPRFEYSQHKPTMRTIQLAAIFVATATALPGDPLFKRQTDSFCETLHTRVKSATQDTQVTAYCSSYLSVPAVTTTQTFTVAGATTTT